MKLDPETEAALDAAIAALRPYAEKLEATTTRTLKGSYVHLVNQHLASLAAKEDARRQQWAVSMDIALLDLRKSGPSGHIIYRTPRRTGQEVHELGDYAVVSGMHAVGELVETIGAPLGAPFTAESLRAALVNLRGPISRYGGIATMHRAVLAPWTLRRPGPGNPTYQVDAEWHLHCTVCRLELAREHCPPRREYKLRPLTPTAEHA